MDEISGVALEGIALQPIGIKLSSVTYHDTVCKRMTTMPIEYVWDHFGRYIGQKRNLVGLSIVE